MPKPTPTPNQVRTLCSVLAKMDPEPMVSQFEHSLKQKPGVRLDQLNLRDEICIALLGECSGSFADAPISALVDVVAAYSTVGTAFVSPLRNPPFCL